MTVTFTTAAEAATRSFRVYWSTDSTDFSNYSNSVQVAPRNYPISSTYEVLAGVFNTNVPVYFKVKMDSGTNFTGTSTYASNALLATEPKPLPVVLSAFEAKRVAAGAQLTWTTASEVNNAGFQVQRSADSRAWQTIQFLPGAGTTLTAQHYQALDPSSSAAYYRVAQQDVSGQLTYSPVRYVAGTGLAQRFSAYPNPSQGLDVKILGAEASLPVQLLTTTGQQLREITGSTLALAGLAPGVYILRQGANVTRLVIQ
ncbi:MAG: T9SS type A sorting domain-containing protein [Hymenobacter sp.]|nr:MAG: T9SS type A sorting domain-containing protein [Hymenobacter sp.]